MTLFNESVERSVEFSSDANLQWVYWKCIETVLWMQSSVCSCTENESFSQKKSVAQQTSTRTCLYSGWVQQMRPTCFLRTSTIGVWSEWRCRTERCSGSIDLNGECWTSCRLKTASRWCCSNGIQQNQVFNKFIVLWTSVLFVSALRIFNRFLLWTPLNRFTRHSSVVWILNVLLVFLSADKSICVMFRDVVTCALP